MANFRLVDRHTSYLLPPSLDEWLPENHLARFVVEITDQLDISAIGRQYTASGSNVYHPRMLLALLFYSYATGIFLSRTFRRRFLGPIGELFTQILLIAAQMDMVALGVISIDGTKVKANASKHKATSWERMVKLEDQLSGEVAELLERAEKQERTGKKPRGRTPKSPERGSRGKNQVNFTDPQSRIMPTSNGWQQVYNAQAEVDMNSHLIVGSHLSQAPNNKQQLQPALDQLKKLYDAVGSAKRITADKGCYYSEDNVNEAADRELTPTWPPVAANTTPAGTSAGRTPARHRTIPPRWRPCGGGWKATVETVFGIIKQVMGFRQFLPGGFEKVAGEWNLVQCAYNLKRMHALTG